VVSLIVDMGFWLGRTLRARSAKTPSSTIGTARLEGVGRGVAAGAGSGSECFSIFGQTQYVIVMYQGRLTHSKFIYTYYLRTKVHTLVEV